MTLWIFFPGHFQCLFPGVFFPMAIIRFFQGGQISYAKFFGLFSIRSFFRIWGYFFRRSSFFSSFFRDSQATTIISSLFLIGFLVKYCRFFILVYYINILINFIENRLLQYKKLFFAEFKPKKGGTFNILTKIDTDMKIKSIFKDNP